MGKGIDAATKHARRKPTPPWSPEVASANARLQYWQLALAHHTHNRQVQSRQKELLKHMLPSDKPEAVTYGLASTKKQLRQARWHWRHTNATAEDHRIRFLREKMVEAELQQDWSTGSQHLAVRRMQTLPYHPLPRICQKQFVDYEAGTPS